MTDETPLQRTLDLLWNGWTAATKGPKPSLTLEQIIETGVQVADAEGVDAISMRRIARELDVGTMGLYRYVPEKAVLLDLMLNYVWAQSAHARGDESHRTWRDVLETDARSSRDMHLEHPWLLQINSIRPVLGPGAVTSMELAMSGLKELPFTDREKIILLSALDAYVTGSVRQEIMYSQAAEESGISDEEFWGSSLPYMERAMASGDYPTMATMDDDCFDAGWSETFEYGLKRLLDGVEADLATSHPD